MLYDLLVYIYIHYCSSSLTYPHLTQIPSTACNHLICGILLFLLPYNLPANTHPAILPTFILEMCFSYLIPWDFAIPVIDRFLYCSISSLFSFLLQRLSTFLPPIILIRNRLHAVATCFSVNICPLLIYTSEIHQSTSLFSFLPITTTMTL